MSERMLIAKEIAKHFGVSNSTARGWLLRGRFKGAELRQSELGQPYWVAPETSVKTFTPPKPGPVPKSVGNGASNSKKRGKK
jgi:transposase